MRPRAYGAAFGAAITLILVVSATASAHVVKQFGTYDVALGWLHEPADVGLVNAVQVVVKDAAGQPVSDLEAGDLKVVVSISGQQTAALPLESSFDEDTGLGTPGEYDAVVTPTQVGAYTFHLTGSIHGQAVDETATSGDTTFDAVTEGTDVQFPVKLPALTDLSALTQRIDGRVTSEQAAVAQAQAKAVQASDDAGRATLIGGLLGGLGVAFGLLALLFSLRLSRRRT